MSDPRDPLEKAMEAAVVRTELDDLKSANARLRDLISNRDAENGQLWAELWQEVDERNKTRADNVRLRERLKDSDMLAHVRGEQIERLTAALAFYADRVNWHWDNANGYWIMGEAPWDEARRALEGK